MLINGLCCSSPLQTFLLGRKIMSFKLSNYLRPTRYVLLKCMLVVLKAFSVPTLSQNKTIQTLYYELRSMTAICLKHASRNTQHVVGNLETNYCY